MINKNNKIGKRVKRIFLNIVLLTISLFSLYPIYWMIVSTFSSKQEMFKYPPKLFITKLTLENIVTVVEKNPFARNLFNSLFVSISFVILSLFLCSLAGYAFAKFDFPFKKVLFIIVLATYAVPFAIQLIPLFIFMVKINWEDTLPALFLPWVGNAFGIFWLRQNIISFPDEVMDAARMDGCSEFSIYFKIVLPNLKPALSSIGIILFIFMYNDFLWPLIVIQTEEMSTLPLLLAAIRSKLRYELAWGELIAGCFLVTLPMIIAFLILQRYLVKGILGGAIKE